MMAYKRAKQCMEFSLLCAGNPLPPVSRYPMHPRITTSRKITASFWFGICLLLAFAQVLHADDAEKADAEKEQIPAKWLVVHAGNLLAIPGKPPLGPSTIVIKDGRIEQVKKGFAVAAELVPEEAQADFKFLDLSQEFVLPGLMDMHVHLSMNPDKAEPPEYGTSDAFVREHKEARNDAYGLVTAIENANKTLAAGYTTVRDLGSYGWHIFALRDAIRDGRLSGPRILAAGSIIRVGADSGDNTCSGVESCRRATRTQIDKGADLIKVYATCSGGKPCGTRDAPPVFLPDEIQAVVETAASRELKVAAHAHGTAGIILAASSGVASIDHGSYNDEEAREVMIEKGVFLVPTLAVQDRIKKDIETATGPMLQVMQSFLDNHAPGMLAAYKAGVKIASGSDAGITEHGNNARELEIYVETGLTPEQAIVTATVNAAELIGRTTDLGTIEEGKLADLIAVRENPLENIAALKSVVVVVKEGDIAKDSRLAEATPVDAEPGAAVVD